MCVCVCACVRARTCAYVWQALPPQLLAGTLECYFVVSATSCEDVYVISYVAESPETKVRQ